MSTTDWCKHSRGCNNKRIRYYLLTILWNWSKKWKPGNDKQMNICSDVICIIRQHFECKKIQINMMFVDRHKWWNESANSATPKISKAYMYDCQRLYAVLEIYFDHPFTHFVRDGHVECQPITSDGEELDHYHVSFGQCNHLYEEWTSHQVEAINVKIDGCRFCSCPSNLRCGKRNLLTSLDGYWKLTNTVLTRE